MIYTLKNGKVFAYDDGQEELAQHRIEHEGHAEISSEQADAILNPPPTEEQLAAQARAERDAKLTATTWLVERHREEQETGATTLTAQQYTDLLAYRQALRDAPQQPGFPESIDWPENPLQ